MSDSENKDQPENERQPGEAIPSGMVRKTRRVRKRRRSQESSSRSREDAARLFDKAKELLMGMQDEDNDYGHIDLAEQVRRLKRKTEDDRPLDEIWGTKRRSTSWLWIVLVGAIFSVIAIVAGITYWASDEPVDQSVVIKDEDDRFEVEDVDLSKGPLGWFDANSLNVLNEVRSIITKVNDAEEVGSIENLIRDSPFRTLNPVDLDSVGSPMRTNSLSKFQWIPKIVRSTKIAGSKKRGFLEVSGTREDRSPYTAFFVLQDNQVCLDWDATTGWSEMPIEELVVKKPIKPMLLRCRVTKEHEYDQMFGDNRYSGYVLAGEVPDQFLFAYIDLETARGKDIDLEMRKLLNFGSFLTQEPPYRNVRATLRVGFRESVGEDGIFEIVEYLHDGWVTP